MEVLGINGVWLLAWSYQA